MHHGRKRRFRGIQASPDVGLSTQTPRKSFGSKLSRLYSITEDPFFLPKTGSASLSGGLPRSKKSRFWKTCDKTRVFAAKIGDQRPQGAGPPPSVSLRLRATVYRLCLSCERVAHAAMPNRRERKTVFGLDRPHRAYGGKRLGWGDE